MKKLIISLDDAHDRRQHIKEQFESNNISYDFFDEWATCRKSDKNIAHGTASINCITKV